MVKRCKTPSFSRSVFTANELCGWPDGIAYSPRVRKVRRKRVLKIVVASPIPPTQRVSIGRSLLIHRSG